MRELIYIFCLDAFEKELAFTPEAFFHWKNNTVVNPNFYFYYDLVFKYTLGIKFFCSGIKHNNSTVALACRQKFAPILLSKHDIYHRVIFYDIKIKTLAT